MTPHSLSQLIQDELRDLFSAENQILKALPKMAKRASSNDLKDAFTEHLRETEGHVKRLEDISNILQFKIGGKKCKAMEGLIEEGKEILNRESDAALIDAALIGSAQRVEHYEMAGYGTARAMAEQLGYDDVAEMLQETLDEEGAADKKLTKIAMEEVLAEAVSSGSEGGGRMTAG